MDVHLKCSQCSHELTERQVYWLHVQTPHNSTLYFFDSEKCRRDWILLHQPLLEKASHITRFEDTLEGYFTRPNVGVIGNCGKI